MATVVLSFIVELNYIKQALWKLFDQDFMVSKLHKDREPYITKDWLDQKFNKNFYTLDENVSCLFFEEKNIYAALGVKEEEFLLRFFEWTEVGPKEIKIKSMPFSPILDKYKATTNSQNPITNNSQTYVDTNSKSQDNDISKTHVDTSFKNQKKATSAALFKSHPATNTNSQNPAVPSSQSSFLKNLFIAFGLILFFIFIN
jgi:hypothetical protein